MTTFFRDFSSLVQRFGYEAKRNVPVAVMVVSAVFIGFLLQAHMPDSLLILILAAPLLAFAGGAFSALLGYLQQIKSDSSGLEFEPSTKLGQTVGMGAPVSVGDPIIQIRGIQDGIILRLSGQIARLGLRANVNLAGGAFICLTGFCILGYFVFFEVSIPGSNRMFEFIVRVTLVVFIEIFAYFFLNLYRAGLYDIKYFQNELTNAAFRMLALEVALKHENSASIKEICQELIRTERNFLIKKNESTHDLRQAEALLQHERSLTETLERALYAVAGRAGGDLNTTRRTGSVRRAEPAASQNRPNAKSL